MNIELPVWIKLPKARLNNVYIQTKNIKSILPAIFCDVALQSGCTNQAKRSQHKKKLNNT